MKMPALPRRYHGLMMNETAAQIKKPLRTVRYLGNRAAMSLPAGREFSKIDEKMAEYPKQAAMKKHPARFAELYSVVCNMSRKVRGFQMTSP
jgi:hypothetical protein